ncbi:hypothetical protein AX15_002870 [Amanita polypyramis BW_CC]|nr:hypothetical protein AX15_002870 [Amanita polypyramis BW_CC]
MNQEITGVARVFSSSGYASSIFNLFQLQDRIAIITGGHRGIGLEIAFAYAEAGAIVYCLDLPQKPGEDWVKVKKYADSLPVFHVGNEKGSKGRMEYVSADVTNQQQMVAVVEDIARTEGRIDVCVACAGILSGGDCLEYPAEGFKEIMNINVNGVLFTAQAAGRIMDRMGTNGSIILIASMSGSVTNKGMHWVAYNSSKAAVIQMGRSMACELGPKGIRVNTISPGYIYTQMTKDFLAKNPLLEKEWASQNPLGRLGRPHELRGVALWLAGDGSTFCTGSDIKVDGGHTSW